LTVRARQKENPMKHFMIKYQFKNGTTEEWHREIARFIAALDNDAELKGKIIYRCMKNRDDASYSHLASAADDAAVKVLQQLNSSSITLKRPARSPAATSPSRRSN
jgi:hypothetical protein